MRVLVVSNLYPPLHIGGYELVCEAAVSALRKRGHAVAVLVSDHRRDEIAEEAQVSRSLRWYPVTDPMPGERLARRVAHVRHNHRELAWLMAEHRPEVVAWYSMGGMSLSLLETVRRRGLPSVAFVEDDWFSYAPAIDQWARMFARFPRAAGALSKLGLPTGVRFRETATWVFNSRYTATVAAHAGLCFDTVLEARSGWDPVFARAPHAPGWNGKLVVVGRVEPRKGVDVAVDALAHLDDGTRLRIIGSVEGQAAYVAGLRDRIEALGLTGRVTFEAPLPAASLAEAYSGASAVLFPVRWDEPRGRVPLEAMASGTPVVATRTGGAAEYLVDGRNCLAVPTGSAAALAGAVRVLAADAGLRQRLQAGGFETAGASTTEGYGERVQELLRSAVARCTDPTA